jgi:hypothetical protein
MNYTDKSASIVVAGSLQFYSILLPFRVEYERSMK